LAVILREAEQSHDFSGASPEATISLDEFCNAAAKHHCVEKQRLTPAQMHEAIGGIANLYLGHLLATQQQTVVVTTSRTFASPNIPLSMIMSEIERCTGTKSGAGEQILLAMEESLLAHFPRAGSHARFPPLGRFTLRDKRARTYELRYADPASQHYVDFLL